MEVGIRKGAWQRAWMYPAYLWSLRWVYAVKKNPEVGIRRIPAYTPQYTTGYSSTFLTRGSQLHGFCTTLYKHRQLCTLCMNDSITKAHRHACNQPTKHTHTHNRVMAFYLGLTGWAGTRRNIHPLMPIRKKKTTQKPRDRQQGLLWASKGC